MIALMSLCLHEVAGRFFLSGDGGHLALHVLTHPVPTRRSSDLGLAARKQDGGGDRADADADRGSGLGMLLRLAPQGLGERGHVLAACNGDRKSTRLNSSH